MHVNRNIARIQSVSKTLQLEGTIVDSSPIMGKWVDIHRDSVQHLYKGTCLTAYSSIPK